MGYFEDLFYEKTLEDFQIDYLDKIPAIPFNEVQDYTKGAINFCNLVKHEMEIVDEENINEITADQFKEKVKNFFDKIVSILKKAWQVIASTIQKFITLMKDVTTKDKINISLEDARKYLIEYNSKNVDNHLKCSGWVFDGNHEADRGLSDFESHMNMLHAFIDKQYANAQEVVNKNGYDNKTLAITKMDANEGFKNELKKHLFGSWYEEGKSVIDIVKMKLGVVFENTNIQDNHLKHFVDTCNEGYKKQIHNATKIYNDSRKGINKYIAYCESYRVFLWGHKVGRKAAKDEHDASIYGVMENAMKNLGRMLMGSSSVMAQYNGAYCQCLRDDWATSSRVLKNLISVHSGKDLDKETKEKQDSVEKQKALTMSA